MKKRFHAEIILLMFCLFAFPSCEKFRVPATKPSPPIQAATYFYDQLTEEEKAIYNALGSAEENTVFVPLPGTDDRTLTAYFQNAADALLRDKPELFYLAFGDGGTSFAAETSGDMFGIRLTIVCDTVFPANAEELFRDAVVAFPVSGEAPSEIALSIAETLASRVTYAESADGGQTAYGALVNGEASCLGFAQAYSVLCRYHGVPAITVSGTYGYGESLHAWNRVQVEDNRIYHVDVSKWNGDSSELFGSSSFADGNKSVAKLYHTNGDLSGFDEKVFNYPTLSYYGFSVENE